MRYYDIDTKGAKIGFDKFNGTISLSLKNMTEYTEFSLWSDATYYFPEESPSGEYRWDTVKSVMVGLKDQLLKWCEDHNCTPLDEYYTRMVDAAKKYSKEVYGV